MTYNQSVMDKLNTLAELKNLTPAEREKLNIILEEYSKNGRSDTYDKMQWVDYSEIPVDIETFLYDPKYLGKGLIDAEGKMTVFPYWVDILKKIFPDNKTTAYNTLVLTGSIGIGKSFTAVICILYMLYRMLCLKDPYLYYGLQPIDKITFSLINITLDSAKGVAWDKIQQLLQSSEWFLNHGELKGRENVSWQPSKNIELIVGSRNNHIIGRAVFANFTDEVNFGVGNDVERLKEKQKTLISQVDARMQSRFMKGTYLPTLNIIASSKRTEQSFLESYIDMKRKNESTTTLIIDEPQWKIRPDKGSPDDPDSFYVAVGNKFLASELLPRNCTEDLVDEYRRKGYQMLKVPSGYYENFLDDVDIALTDIAGISTISSMKYISGAKWNEIKDLNIQNAFVKDIIEVGNARDDTAQYSDFFDISRIPSSLRSKPLFIHLDMSISGDKTGIGGVFIAGKKPKIEGEASTKELFYQVGFSVSIKAPKGYQISFEKNRTFIRWLREQGFKIANVSSDTFQSAQIQQQLKADDFNTSIISVDRVDPQSKAVLPYQYFKSVVYERRLKVYDKCDLLTEEVIGLERLGNGKIEHSDAGRSGSKDQCDGIVGALYAASQYGDKYAYDFGEDVSTVVDVSSTIAGGTDKKQLQVDFEQQLQQMFGKQDMLEKAVNPPQQKEQFTPEQFEKAKPMQSRPPAFVVQEKGEKPVILQNDMLIW